MPRMSRYQSSRYNFAVPLSGHALLFNAASGAIVRLNGADSECLARYLCQPPGEIDTHAFDPGVWKQLRDGGFVVPVDTDETESVRRRYWRARVETPMVVTITTTMECNLGCYYCYERRSKQALSSEQLPALLAWVRERLLVSRKKSLHVDWYGGEPLLNPAFMEAASGALQALCAELGVDYRASVISNGTCWPDDPVAFVRAHRIQQAQISFDGLRANHDRRRHYRKAYRDAESTPSSFEQAVALVDRLVSAVRVDLRFNIDAKNAGDMLPFLEFAQKRGWFSAPFPAVFQPARLASYSERSGFMRRHELPLAEYDALRAEARAWLSSVGNIEEAEIPTGYPSPKSSVCAALAEDSVVVGGDGLAYRCGLQVGEAGRAVGAIARTEFSGIPIELESDGDAAWWKAFDPCDQPRCRQCSFLPICWGGCPKKHLEQDQHALREQSDYWRRNLARLIAAGANEALSTPVTYADADQFRLPETDRSAEI